MEVVVCYRAMISKAVYTFENHPHSYRPKSLGYQWVDVGFASAMSKEMVRLKRRHCLGPASTQVSLEQYQQVRQLLISVNRHICYTRCYTLVELDENLGRRTWPPVGYDWDDFRKGSERLFVVVDVREHITTLQIIYVSLLMEDIKRQFDPIYPR